MPAKTRFAEIASVTISGKGMGVAAGAEAAVGPVVAVATGALVSAAGRAVFASASANKTKQSLSFMLEPTYRSFYGMPAQPRIDANGREVKLAIRVYWRAFVVANPKWSHMPLAMAILSCPS